MEKVKGQVGAVPGLQNTATAGNGLPENVHPSQRQASDVLDDTLSAAGQGGGVLSWEPKDDGRGSGNPKWQRGKARTWFASSKEQEIRRAIR